MYKNELGKTGLMVTPVGLGGIPLQRLSQEEANEVIRECKYQGINFIDTANGYTVSESYIGNALDEIGRENFIIATKAMGYKYEDMKAYIEKSLQDMHLEYIDLYQVHNCSKEEQFEQLMAEDGGMKALLEAKEVGKIKHIGITSHSVDLMKKFVEMDVFETIQFPYNIVEQQIVEVFKRAKELGRGIICMKPLAGGAISNGDIALRYIMSEDLVTVTIPGMDSADQVRNNVQSVFHAGRLTETDNKEIEKIRADLGNDFCRRCGYCKPCPQGIDIPGMFLFEGYASRYGLKDWAKARYSSLEVNASDCVECGLCESKCPYELPIREKLKKVVEVFAD